MVQGAGCWVLGATRFINHGIAQSFME